MPSSVTFTDNSGAFLDMVRLATVKGLDNAGQVGVMTARPLTPVDTGYARDSEHHVVLDEAGGFLMGDQTDANGNAVPSYPSNGMLCVVVGSNTIPRDGTGYFVGLEFGVFSAKGSAMLAQGMDAASAVVLDSVKQALVRP